jgi:hypothetical protein
VRDAFEAGAKAANLNVYGMGFTVPNSPDAVIIRARRRTAEAVREESRA